MTHDTAVRASVSVAPNFLTQRRTASCDGASDDARRATRLRIISGTLRGRDLGSVPKGVRPTTDRVRESLFSSLGPIDGCAVLDLFAGSGALGLEAYSRGAERVVFVERSNRVARALRKRLSTLGLEEAEALRIVVTDARRAIARLADATEGGFDLVFVDPPYVDGGESERESAIEALFAAGVLAPEARVVVEGPTRHPLAPLPGIRVVNERRYGDTLLTWLAAE